MQPHNRPANPVLEALTTRLTGQNQGVATSASSNLQNTIEQAVRETQQAGDATAMQIQSERQREVGFAQDRAAARFTGALESRRGFATQVAGLRELTETTEKSLRDLDARYKEAILMNDAQTAERVAGLRIKSLEFAVEQEQNFFRNMLTLAGLFQAEESQNLERARQASDERRFFAGMQHEQFMLDRRLREEERMVMAQVAGEHGVAIEPGDTLERVVGRVSPMVSQERALRLQGMLTEIQMNQARTKQALAGQAGPGPMDASTIDSLALAQMMGFGDVGNVLRDDPTAIGLVARRVSQLTAAADRDVRRYAEISNSREEFMQLVTSGPSYITTEQVANMEKLYAEKWTQRTNQQNRINREQRRAEQRQATPQQPARIDRQTTAPVRGQTQAPVAPEASIRWGL